MAGISKIDELQQRKLALIAESDLHRQRLRYETTLLRAHCSRVSRTLSLAGSLGKIMSFLPLFAPLVGLRRGRQVEPKPAPGWRRWLGTVLAGWRVYNRFGPTVQNLVKRQHPRHPSSRER